MFNISRFQKQNCFLEGAQVLRVSPSANRKMEIKVKYGALLEFFFSLGESEVLPEKRVPLPLSPPLISHKLAWDRTRAYVVRDQRLNLKYIYSARTAQ
jgi:hypothetical protein